MPDPYGIEVGNNFDIGAAEAYHKAVVGDFNGDGRDDVFLQNPSDKKWRLAVSDGTTFFVDDIGVVGDWPRHSC